MAGRILNMVVLFAAALLLAGCSTFSRDWRKAAADPPPLDDIHGRWEGRWRSGVDGHDGRLRCLITREQPDRYQARYQAIYRGFLKFTHTVPLEVERVDGLRTFRGEADLGKWAGGVYEYAGYADATNFFSTYESRYDHGTYRMSRPK